MIGGFLFDFTIELAGVMIYNNFINQQRINSMKYKLCLSDTVQVKLTKLGYEVFDNCLGKARDYLGDDIIPTPQADENGLHSFVSFTFAVS